MEKELEREFERDIQLFLKIFESSIKELNLEFIILKTGTIVFKRNNLVSQITKEEFINYINGWN